MFEYMAFAMGANFNLCMDSIMVSIDFCRVRWASSMSREREREREGRGKECMQQLGSVLRLIYPYPISISARSLLLAAVSGYYYYWILSISQFFSLDFQFPFFQRFRLRRGLHDVIDMI